MTQIFTTEQVEFFRTFLKDNSGYNLVEGKEYLLESRLKIVKDIHDLESFEKIITAIKANPHGNIAIDTVEAMTVNETFFFRDDQPFEVFKEKIIPQLAQLCETRPVKIWSAACSTGQEPYSIAIMLEESKVKYPNLQYEIEASDINNRILAKARHGSYSYMEAGRGLLESYKNKYFTQYDDTWRVNQEIRNKVTFFQQNLREEFKAFKGPYDLIFLRNVLIYFDGDLKREVLRKSANVMNTGAYMILGVAENIYDTSLNLERVSELTGIYTKTCSSKS